MGSSNSKKVGSEIKAREIASIWRSPPDSEAARSCTLLRRSGNILSDLSILSLRVLVSSVLPPICRFSSTVKEGNTLSTCGT